MKTIQISSIGPNTKYKKKVSRPQNNSFKAIKPDYNYLYNKSLSLHKANIFRTNPSNIEKYFERMGIEANFREGNEHARKMVAYCCYQASEIFKQLTHAIPVKIDLTDFRKFNIQATGFCNYRTMTNPKLYPIRTVAFNTFDENIPLVIKNKNMFLKWENFDLIQQDNFDKGFLSVNHFMSPFIHEFAHNLHYHKLFSKFGCQELHPHYSFNPNTEIILQKLNMPLSDSFGNPVKNPFVSTHLTQEIKKDISAYGSTQLPETFAEAYTKDVIDCMDVFNLRLTQNPFGKFSKTPEMQQVLSEIWEGLVGDGAGLI